MSKKIKNLILDLIIIALIAAIGYNGYNVYAEYADNMANTDIRDNIDSSIKLESDTNYFEEGAFDPSKFPTGNNSQNNNSNNNSNKYNPVNTESSKFVYADFKDLKSKNEETAAWVLVPNTGINYSVLQTDNNEYYLKHNFNKEYNRAGWIFGDYRSNFDILDRHTVLYGHNQLSSSMFGDLKKLKNTEGWFNTEENKYIYLATEKATYVFEIVSIHVAKGNYYIKHGLDDDKVYQEWLDYIAKENIIPELTPDLDINDHILTLSTCHSGDRLAIHAKLIKTKIL